MILVSGSVFPSCGSTTDCYDDFLLPHATCVRNAYSESLLCTNSSEDSEWTGISILSWFSLPLPLLLLLRLQDRMVVSFTVLVFSSSPPTTFHSTNHSHIISLPLLSLFASDLLILYPFTPRKFSH